MRAYSRLTPRFASGFALPTILIVSVVMFIVLTGVIASGMSVRTALNGQYYRQLALEAAESGIVVAQMCLESSNNVVTWSDAKPLMPNTDCNGTVTQTCPVTLRHSQCGVIDSPLLRTSFTVGAASVDGDGKTMLRAGGSVALLRASSSAIWSTHDQSASAAIGPFRTWESTAQFASGYYNTVMILSDGQAYGVGLNSLGQLAQNNFDAITKFSQYRLDLATGRLSTGPLTAKKVVANWGSVMVIASDGQVYGSGSQAAGSLGDGVVAPGYTSIDDFNTSYRTPVPVRYELPAGWTAKDIIPTAAGVAYVLAAPNASPADVQLFGAGRNDQGMLGDGTLTGRSTPVQFQVDNAEARVSTGHLTIKEVDTYSPSGRMGSATHTCVVASDEDVYCAGYNNYSQFGAGSVAGQRYGRAFRVALPVGVKAKDVFLTNGVVFVLGVDNQLYASGLNTAGILGDGTSTSRASFAKVRLDLAVGRTSSTLTVRGVAILYDSIHVLASDGNVYSAGVNNNGRFGNGTTTDSSYLTKMNNPFIAGEQVISVKTSGSKTLSRTVYMLTNKGRVLVVGNNSWGQIGDGTTTDRSTPVIWPLPTGAFATDILVSTYTDRASMHVMLSDGRIYAAGANQGGQIGDNTQIDRSSPVRMDLSLPIPRTKFYF